MRERRDAEKSETLMPDRGTLRSAATWCVCRLRDSLVRGRSPRRIVVPHREAGGSMWRARLIARSVASASGASFELLHRGVTALAIVAAGVLITACGLPTIPFLAPPQNPGSSGLNEENTPLTFEHNPENDIDDFRGYDLYYKLYLDSQTDEIAADASFIDSTPTQPGPSRLTQRGFVRAVAATERNAADRTTVETLLTGDGIPHLPTAPTATPIEYLIDLTGTLGDDPDADVVVSWEAEGGRARGFRRRSTAGDFGADPQSSLAGFWNRSTYLSTDWDLRQMNLAQTVATETPDRLVIIWYVLAYGIQGTDFSGYYSEPLRLDRALIVLRP
jgi:hypothetical protein